MDSVEWLVGMVVGDGRISDRYVRVYNNDAVIIRKCKTVFDKYFQMREPKLKIRLLSKNRDGFLRSTETTELTVNSKRLSRIFGGLRKQFLSNPTSDFISGLFDAEGSIDLRGTVTFWQRKNASGNEVIQSVAKWLTDNRIKFSEIRNAEFHILEIKGSYKNYTNLHRFLRCVKFTAEKKVKDSQLILDIYSKHSTVSESDILTFVSANSSVTVRDVIESFRIPKMMAYTKLNKLAKGNTIIKIKSYPDRYVYSRWHSTIR